VAMNTGASFNYTKRSAADGNSKTILKLKFATRGSLQHLYYGDYYLLRFVPSRM
jgi:hypothetical protein